MKLVALMKNADKEIKEHNIIIIQSINIKSISSYGMKIIQIVTSLRIVDESEHTNCNYNILDYVISTDAHAYKWFVWAIAIVANRDV